MTSTPPINPLKTIFGAKGPPAIGAFCAIPDASAATALGTAGLDFVFIDTEHGLPTMDALVTMLPALQATGTPSLVRLPWNDPAQAMRALDLGASGVVIPMVSTAEEAAHAVRACRYPPAGIRSFGQVAGTRYGGTDATNAQVLCIVMIETSEGLENAEEIARTPGVDGIFIGPIDLMLSMGLPLDFTLSHPALVAALARIVDAGKHNGCAVGFPLFGMHMAPAVAAAGYRFLTVGSDTGHITAGATKSVSDIRALMQGDQA